MCFHELNLVHTEYDKEKSSQYVHTPRVILLFILKRYRVTWMNYCNHFVISPSKKFALWSTLRGFFYVREEK